MVSISSASRSLTRELVNQASGLNITRSIYAPDLTGILPSVKNTSFVSLCKMMFEPVKSLLTPYHITIVALCLLILILLYMIINSIGSIGIDQQELDRASADERTRLDNNAKAERDRLDAEAKEERDRLDSEAVKARSETNKLLEAKYLIAQEKFVILHKRIEELQKEISVLRRSNTLLKSTEHEQQSNDPEQERGASSETIMDTQPPADLNNNSYEAQL